MKLYRDSEQLTRVRWFWCEPDAQEIPYFHPFTSANWEDGQGPGLLGEQPGYRRWDAGENKAGLLGQDFCGTQDDWENGGEVNSGRNFPVAAEYSKCCGQTKGVAGLPVGAALSGDPNHDPRLPAVVGLASEAWADPYPLPPHVAAGGALAGGAAEQVLGAAQAGAGGLLAGGLAGLPEVRGQIAGGGALAGGAAALLLVFKGFSGQGGAVAGGTAGITLRKPHVAAGGALAGGHSGFSLRQPQRAAGGALAGGNATFSLRGPQRAAGGALAGGKAGQARNPP